MDKQDRDPWQVVLDEMLSRRALGSVATGAIAALGLAIEGDAKKKKKKKKKKKPGKCNPEPKATTCAGKCGSVTNNCDQQVSCDPCGYIFDLSWGGLGSANGKFDTPAGIAVDADGDVYVADTQNDRIQRFSGAGQHKASWVQGGFDENAISTPLHIAINGNVVYVTSQFLNKIQIFNRNGQFQGILSDGPSSDPGKLDNPHGMDTAANGNLVIADTDNNRGQILTSSGGYVDDWGSGPSSTPGNFDFPTYVAVDASGNIFVVDWGNDRVQKFTSSGTFDKQWGGFGSGDSNFDGPEGIAVDAAGNVYVADAGNRTIKKFTNDGVFITRIGSPAPADGTLGFGLKGLALDAQGNVFVINGEEVTKFNPPSAASTLRAESRSGAKTRDNTRRRRHARG